MKTAHAGLHIGEREWQAMISDLKATMRKVGVPEEVQGDVIAVFEETKKDIVLAPAPGSVSGAPAPDHAP